MKLLHTLLLGSLLALAGCATTSSPDLASTAPAPSTAPHSPMSVSYTHLTLPTKRIV